MTDNNNTAMNWKNLRHNPPEGDDVAICLKYPALVNRGYKKYRLASYMQPDPAKPERGAFIVTSSLSRCIIDVSDLPEDTLYISLDDIV